MSDSVPFLELTATHAAIRGELDDALARVIDSGRFVLGAEVETFEAEFAEYCGAAHCVGVNSGLDAIEVLLRAHGIGPGDEVVVPAHTFVATWLGVTRAGAIPVPADVRPGTYDLDSASVAGVLTERTAAIMPVHLYGLVAELEPLRDLAAARGLLLIEDAAQAHGARDADGRRAGSLSDGAAFSFYPGKNLGALGDAGAILTSDDAVARRCRELRNYGSLEKYRHDARGANSRLDEIQAAVLRVKLGHLDEWNARRTQVAGAYLEALRPTGLDLPGVRDRTTPAWHLFVVRTNDRDRLQATLTARGVGTLIHYPVPPHATGAYREASVDVEIAANAQRLCDAVLSLPMGPHLGDGQIARVADAVIEAGRG